MKLSLVLIVYRSDSSIALKASKFCEEVLKSKNITSKRIESDFQKHEVEKYLCNSKLKPENSTNIDAGLNYVLVNSGLELQASVFNTEVKDEIIYSFSEGYSQSVNSTKRQGLSVGFDYKISDLSKINLRYSTTTDEKGNNVSRIPKNSISLNGQTILFGKLSISGNLKVVRDLEESGEKMEDYNLLNSKLNYPLTDNTQLTLSAENLLDENYETAKGYSTSKRAFYLGYNAKF